MEGFDITNYFGEMIVAGVLMVFGWGFKSWANSLKEGTTEILTEVKNLSKEFHRSQIRSEHRLTKVETKVGIHNGLDAARRELAEEDSA